MAEDERGVRQKLFDTVNEIPSISDYRCTVKKPFANLARRLKLLVPLFEDICDVNEACLDDELNKWLVKLLEDMELANEFLRAGNEWSKIYLVLERDQIMEKYQEVTTRLEQDLSCVSFDKLEISAEVEEQVELVLSQFKRANGRTDAIDVQLYEDLASLYNKDVGAVEEPAVMKRLVEKLHLTEITDLTHESMALHEMVTASSEDPGESIEKMSMLLERIKEFVQTESPFAGSPPGESSALPSCTSQATSVKSLKNGTIPDEFLCPISLELMKDPVIVSTGQTYERSCIEEWFKKGYRTCPETRQSLTSTKLIPNYVGRNLIAQWCDKNGMEPPQRATRAASACTPAELSMIESLLNKLSSVSPDDQRTAAGEIRLLAKRNAENRVAIAAAGVIPRLTHLLTAPDPCTQEHAVTALLNLSLCEDNKVKIVSSDAVPGIVQVLRGGSMEARENAAATLFSLSVIDENKEKIGSLGAIPPLVLLLSEGTQRGKKDAATALLNLCLYQGNEDQAVRSGIIPTLMELLTQPQIGMKDEALAILDILSSQPEGKVALGKTKAVPVLVECIRSGSPRNKENAAAVLVHVCSEDQKYLVEAQELGVMDVLVDLLHDGTERGKRNAGKLIENMNRWAEQQKELAQSVDNKPTEVQAGSPNNRLETND